MRTSFALLIVAAMLALGRTAAAQSPSDVQRTLEAEARQASPSFTGFSPQRGRQLFTATHGREWSCATCHTADPRQAGRHATTQKTIAPLAPSANADRFTSSSKVDKWFRRNCRDVLGRPCTPQEKGDVLAWLLSLGR